MKNLNNRGITTIEIIICFALIVIVATSLYSTVSAYNEKRLVEKYKSEIYSYKNLLTKTVQDDLIKKGLKDANYIKYTSSNNLVEKGNPSAGVHYTEIDDDSSTVVYEVNFTLSDTTSRRMLIYQRFTYSDEHSSGSKSNNDYFTIFYGVPDLTKTTKKEQNENLIEYPIPDLGTYETSSGHKAHDLTINNILINFGNDSIATNYSVLSLYIGFYHPELSTRYAVNIVCPINYISHLSQKSLGFQRISDVQAKSTYYIRYNYGFDVSGRTEDVEGPYNEDDTVVLRKNIYNRPGYVFKGYSLSENGSDLMPSETKVSRLGKNRQIVNIYYIWEKVEKKYSDVCKLDRFEIPKTGDYLLEVWGAQGGGDSSIVGDKNSYPFLGGYGGYARAIVSLNQDDVIYINVGEQGSYSKDAISLTDHKCMGSSKPSSDYKFGNGGGATYVSKKGDQLYNLSDADIYVIGAGGGGAGGINPSNSKKTNSSGGPAGYFNHRLNASPNTFELSKISTLSFYVNGSQSGNMVVSKLPKPYTTHMGREPVGGSSNSYSAGGGSGMRGGYYDIKNTKVSLHNYGASGGISYSVDSTSKVSSIYSTVVSSYSEEPEANKFKLGNGYAKVTLLT